MRTYVAIFIVLLFPLSLYAKNSKAPNVSVAAIPHLSGDVFKEALSIYVSSVPDVDEEIKGGANFVSGYKAFRVGDYAAALRYFRALDDKFPLRDHRDFFVALCLFETAQYEDALDILTYIHDQYPSSIWTPQANYLHIKTLIEMKRYSEALEIIDNVRQDTPLLTVLTAEAQIRSKNIGSAKNTVRGAIRNARSKEDCVKLFEMLSEHKISRSFLDTPDYVAGAASLQSHGDPTGALRLLHESNAKNDSNVKRLIAAAYSRIGNYAEAQKIYKELLKEDGATPGLSEEYMKLLLKLGDFDMAIKKYREKVDDSNSKGERDNNKYKLATVYVDAGDLESAREIFEELSASGYKTQNAKWHLAWITFRLKDHKAAAEIFKELERTSNTYDKRRAGYWRAVSLERSGQKNEASVIYRDITHRGKLDYYGLLSTVKINEDSYTLVQEQDGKSDDEEEITDNGELEDGQFSNEHLENAILLDKLGVSELAAPELRAVNLRTIKLPSTRRTIAVLAFNNHAYDVCYRLTAFKGGNVLSNDVLKYKYPKVYARYVEHVAKLGKTDPMLLMAVMREESHYNPTAISPAGAIGLMQIIPSTARTTAEKNKMSFTSSYDLLSPATSISLGMKYLTFLQKLYKGNIAYMLAAYNAGEQNVSRWTKNAPEEIEIFIEEIPYKETNRYVKKVMASYWVYKMLYPK